MKHCFECGNEATENHHVIPKSLGGTKTIPLCSRCHSKVHSLEKTRRADLSPELTKRGLDKNRAWELFAVYQAIMIYDADSIQDIKNIVLKEFNLELSKNSALTLQKRLLEMDGGYLNDFFNKHIGNDLSYIWNENDSEIRTGILFSTIHDFITNNEVTNLETIDKRLIESLFEEVNDKFMRAKL